MAYRAQEIELQIYRFRASCLLTRSNEYGGNSSMEDVAVEFVD